MGAGYGLSLVREVQFMDVTSLYRADGFPDSERRGSVREPCFIIWSS